MMQQQVNESISNTSKSFTLSNTSPHIVYSPQAKISDENWCHPLLGYPMCPLIGRHNNGQYIIGDVILHLEFICSFDNKSQNYQCGTRQLDVPGILVYNMRNIPQVIPYNKPKEVKNEPNVHLLHYKPEKIIKLNFIISFGQLTKDFINYINHCYVFDESVFDGNKFHRTTFNLPIIAYLPKGSNLNEEEAVRGISMNEWRSQYLSIHLKGGAPAFSPNNMRLAMKGQKKTNYQHNQYYEQKNEYKNKKKKQYKLKQENPKQQEKVSQQTQKKSQQQSNDNVYNHNLNNGAFIHFYTAVLLQHDHRINYHWHIEQKQIQNTIKQLLSSVGSVEEFIQMYKKMRGNDSMIQELSKLLLIAQ